MKSAMVFTLSNKNQRLFENNMLKNKIKDKSFDLEFKKKRLGHNLAK
ncbi:hypothetical protein J4714_12330 [Staphylococcus epidermidis]|nr:hypothetical protein [Staphylococcus epidermidis]MBO1996714.1 hypothetical protein [Staphylococcus epidermidis]